MSQNLPQVSDALTLDQLKACAPLKIRKNITQDMCNLVNSACDDENEREIFRENILTFSDVLMEGKWKYQSYIDAVKYVSHKMLGNGNTLAWSKVFPKRYQKMIDAGYSSKDISAHTTQFNQRPIVTKIMERTLIPIHVLNSDILQEAIRVQAFLMKNAKSETVRTKAAANLIENLKAPETLKVDLKVGVSNDTVEDLREVTRALAVEQRRMIESGGMTAQGIAEMEVIKKEEEIVEAEFVEMEPDPVSRGDIAQEFFNMGKK